MIFVFEGRGRNSPSGVLRGSGGESNRLVPGTGGVVFLGLLISTRGVQVHDSNSLSSLTIADVRAATRGGGGNFDEQTRDRRTDFDRGHHF